MKHSNLIFLISQPRAGSTLLQNLLARHPKIHTTPEPWILLPQVYALREEGHSAEYNEKLAYTALIDFCDILDGGISTYDEAIRKLAYHLYGTACEQANKQFFIDKTPRYYHILPELKRIFPNAKHIFLYRNPLAVLNSLLETHVKGHWVLLSRYKHDLLTAPQKMSTAVYQSSFTGYTLQYENLVADPQGQLTSLANFLEIEFNRDMLTYNPSQAASGHMGDSTGIQIYNHPTTDRMNQWIEMGHHAQTRHFSLAYLDALGPKTIAKMGYDSSELRSLVENTPCKNGSVEVTWQQLFTPDNALKKRLYLIEMALLEHRRLVHAWQKFKSRINQH